MKKKTYVQPVIKQIVHCEPLMNDGSMTLFNDKPAIVNEEDEDEDFML